MDAAKATKTNAAYGMGENLVLLFLHQGYSYDYLLESSTIVCTPFHGLYYKHMQQI